MQFLNNLSERGRVLLIGIVTIFIFIPLCYFAYSLTNNNNPNNKGTYYDKGSGQTVINGNEQPETYGVPSDKPTYLGTTKLLDIGVTKYQLAAIEDELLSFAKTVADKPSELSIDGKSIAPVSYDPSSANPVSQTSFTLLLDRKKKYTVQLQYSGLSVARILVSPFKGAQIYDSGAKDGANLTE